jgi:hypothetical protein
MKDDLPTPEELGEKLKRGEITKEEAIEVMSERARRDAFANLFGPMPAAAGATPTGSRTLPWKAIAGFVLALAAATVLLWLLLRLLA